MKTIIALLLLSAPLFAIQSRRIIPSVGAPIPANYSTNGQSLVLSELPLRDHSIYLVALMNSVACKISEPYSSVAPATPADSALTNEVYLVASEPIILKDGGPGKNVYCRSTTGTVITSGQLFVHVY